MSAKKNQSQPQSQTTTEETSKKVKKPALVRYQAAQKSLEAVPQDFDPEKHRPLSRKQFKSKRAYLLYMADEYERRAKRLRERAEKAGKYTDRVVTAKSEKLRKLAEELQKSGLDVSTLLSDGVVKANK